MDRPLEPYDGLSGPGVLDERVVDGLLRHEPAVRDLRGVDDLDVRGQLVEQIARAEPVGDDDVRLGEQAPSAHGDEVGIAGSAADQGDARGRAVAVARGGERSVTQPLHDGVAHGGRPARVVAGEDGHGHALAAAGGGCPGGGGCRVVAPDAPDAAPLGLGRCQLVGLRVTGRDQYVPGSGQVAVRIGAPLPGDLTRRCHRLDRGSGRRRDEQDVPAGSDERGEAALCDLPAADDDDAPAGEAESYGVGGVIGVLGHGVAGSSRGELGLRTPLRR